MNGAAIVVALALLAPTLVVGQSTPADLSVGNYQFVGEERASRTQWFVTYRATLVNTGVARASVTAKVTSLGSNVQVLPGQDTLHFTQVPANGQVISTDTFIILVDRSVPFYFTTLQWSFVNPAANAGPNQTASVGSTVTLNGSGSSNPSGAGALTYTWSFTLRPAGSNAVLLNANSAIASFVVDVPGNYVVSLIVNNGLAQDSATVTVSTVNSPPVAKAGPNQTAPVGATISLNGGGSSDVDGDPLSYFWTMASRPAGSGAVLTGVQSVAATFVTDQPGTYVVQLVVNDGKVNSAPSTVTISTTNTSPVANAGPSQTVGVGALVQLNGAASTDVDSDPLIYKWSLLSTPANSVAHLSSVSAVNPTFAADQPGTYIAQLVVNDGKIDSLPATVTITTAAIQSPTANAGANQTVAHGTTVTLSAAGSDTQGLPLTLSWSLLTRPAGSAAVLSSSSVPHPTFLADKPGTYIAQLIVSNGWISSAPATVTITTTNTIPVADAGSNRQVNVGDSVVLSGAGSSDADHDALTYTWSFASRPAGSAATLQSATSATPSFTADVAGTFVVQLIVNDGYVASVPITVTITAQAIILLPANLTLAPGETAQFPITLSKPATSSLYIDLSSSDSTRATLSMPNVIVAAGQTQPNRQPSITGGAVGAVTITASAPGIPASLSQVTVGIVTAFSPNSLTLSGSTGSLTLTLSSPAPASFTLTLTSSNAGVVSFTSTQRVSIGAQVISIPLTAIGHGTTHITASAPGLTDATAVVIVN